MRRHRYSLLSLAVVATVFAVVFLNVGSAENGSVRVASAEWITPVGAGLVAPACGSSGAGSTCSAGQPSVSFSWNSDNPSCNSVTIELSNSSGSQTWSSSSLFTYNPGSPLPGFPCTSGSYSWNGGQLGETYYYTIYSNSVNISEPAHYITTGGESVTMPASCIAPPTATLSASPSSVPSGGRSTLIWGSTGATACTAPSGNWSNAGTLSGNGLTDPIIANTTYTFQCTGDGGTSPLASVIVGVNADNGACSATHYGCTTGTSVSNVSGPSSWTWTCAGIQSSAPVTLSWTWNGVNPAACDYAGVFIDGVLVMDGGITLTCIDGSYTFNGESGTTYAYSVESRVGGASTGVLASGSYAVPGGATNASCSEAKPSPLPTVLLWADPDSIQSGLSSLLKWSSTDATSCTSMGGFSTGSATSNSTGVSTGALTSTQYYQIYCDGPGGRTNSNIATVTVLTPNVSISITPNRVPIGDPVTVSWEAINVDGCTITKNGVAWKALTANASNVVLGSASETINGQTTYEMSCMNDANVTITASRTVNLLPDFEEF